MKPRKVIVMIEMVTSTHLYSLRDPEYWRDVLMCSSAEPEVHQVQANVVKVVEGGKAR